MKVYIVCRGWYEDYGEHGWEILGTFLNKESAIEDMKVQMLSSQEDSDWWVDELEAIE